MATVAYTADDPDVFANVSCGIFLVDPKPPVMEDVLWWSTIFSIIFQLSIDCNRVRMSLELRTGQAVVVFRLQQHYYYRNVRPKIHRIRNMRNVNKMNLKEK